MPIKYKFIFLACFGFLQTAFGQKIQEGLYNDWDYGPNAVTGNLVLTQVAGRHYYKIEKKDPQTALVFEINPSGIVTNTASVTFANGILSHVEETDQWGETYEYRKYIPKGKDEFQATDLIRGNNIFLPGKYSVNVYANGLLVERRSYSFTGQLSCDKNGVAITRYKRYDDPIRFAELREMSFFDVQGRPVVSKFADCHSLVYEYDERDNKISESYRGIQDEPIAIHRSNLAAIRYFYDGENRQVRFEFQGLDGKLTSNINGVTVATYDYAQGYQIKVTRLDSVGHTIRALASGDGIAVVNYEYDNAGSVVSEGYFDEAGKPLNSHSGVQSIMNTYSADNRLVQVSFFDEFGNPCVNRDKIHTIKYVKDEKNRIIQQSGYGIKGEPLKTYTEEVYLLKKKYDEYGRAISTSYWSDSITRMSEWSGAYETVTKFDDDGQPIEYCSLDQNGKPFVAEDGSSVDRLIYNAEGRVAERQFLHKDRLISRERGVTMHYSIIKYGYDQNGQVNELTFWGPDRKPVDATAWIHDSVSVHRIVFTYRGSRIIEQAYYIMGGADPVQKVDCLKNDYINPNGISTGRKNLN